MKNTLFVLLFLSACIAPAFCRGEHETEKENRALSGKSFSGITEVRIEGVFCDVEVRGTNRDDVTVNLVIEDDKTRVYHETLGNSLHIWVKRENGLLDFGPRGKNEIRVSLPEGANCMVKNASGDVSLTGASAARFELSAASGKIEVSRAAGRVVLSSASGDISLDDCAGDVTANSASGSQSFDRVRGGVRTRSASGSIRLTSIDGDIEAESASGSIFVHEIEAGLVSLESASGNLELKNIGGILYLCSQSGSITGRDIRLSGDSTFDTASGDISIDLDNESECSFALASISGSLAVNETKGQKSLRAGNGRVAVTATSASGDIRFY